MTCVGGLSLKQLNPDSFQNPLAAVKTFLGRHVWLQKNRYRLSPSALPLPLKSPYYATFLYIYDSLVYVDSQYVKSALT